MKDSQNLPKKSDKKKPSKAHFFDVVVILLLINITAVLVIVFYLQRINSLNLPISKGDYLPVTAVPLSQDLKSINASAEAYVVYDTATRTVVAGKNQNLRFSPASTAKVMTATVVLGHYKLDDYLTVPESVVSVEGSKMHLVPNEEVSVENLLYGMMLPSGNDAAYTLAYNYPGGVASFVAKMNEKAKEIHLSNTLFLDPAGYDDGNYTTGSDLARLGAYAMNSSEFAKIVKTRSIIVTDKTGKHKFELNNLNELLMYDNVLGIKTGFTNEAGGVLLTALMKNNTLFVVSVLKSQDRFMDTRDLMNFILEKVEFAIPKEVNLEMSSQE